MAMFAKLLRWPRADVELGVAIPVGCLVPLAAMLAVAIAVGVIIGLQARTPASGSTGAVVRVIDDGAAGGPRVLTTQVVPAR